ncbi:MAG: VWA domain-containing protein, partial [Anaerolineae bacterium]|nr:VWA domain-containing protein [Anaerolineae bacterium]
VLWLLLLVPLFIALGRPERSAPDRRQRWFGLVLRLLVLLGLILGLAGAQLERPVETVTTVFVLDVSDSIPAGAKSQAEAFLRQALAAKPDDDRAAVILFGGEPLVEQLPTTSGAMPALSSIPVKNATDIESALRLALALLPNEGGSRIVLLSDGQETLGQASRMAELAAARQVELSVYPLVAGAGSNQQGEVLVEQVTAPGQARQGQAVPVEVVVTAAQTTDATLRLFADGTLIESRPVRLNGGRNRYSFSVPVDDSGFRRFRVEVEAANDTRPQNNRGEAFTTVFGPPRVLLIEGSPGEVTALTTALDAAAMETEVIGPGAMPQSMAELAGYDAVVLANVPAEALPAESQTLLAAFVRDLGRGLVMLGGPDSYGAGGYLRSPLEEALPVDMEIRNQSREPNVALVLAIDKSGSMGACHCDDPNLNQQYSRIPSGLPKIDIAKEAVFQATQVLGDLDYIGVVAFDNAARWALETAPHRDLNAIEQSIGGLTANGQTNIFAGLTAAEESLVDAPARVKHIILLTDGWSSAGAYDALLDRFHEAGITLSVVAAGNGSAEYLKGLAEEGGGKYYPATNMLEVPKIFLKETVRAAGNFVIEEPFLPAPAVAGGRAASPIVRGIDLANAPALLGYNGSTAKDTAQVALLTPRGDPLLATWQYGLGRSVAWTSDLGGRWAQAWLAWDDFPKLAGQLVNWSLPTPGDDRLDVAVTTTGGEVALAATVQDDQGRPRSFLEVSAQLIAGDGTATAVELKPSGPGRYEASTTLPDEGVYLAQITAGDPSASQTNEIEIETEIETETGPVPVAGQTTGLVIPYSPEYARLESDVTLLTDLAALTGGRRLDNPAQTFAPTPAIGRQSRPLWPLLLLLAALLFPLDVAVRRVRLGRREWQQASRWIMARLPGQSTQPSSEAAAPVLHSELFEARQRARERYSAPPPTERPPVSPPKPAAPSPPASPPPEKPASLKEKEEKEEQDTLARLRAAKRRAKR